VAKKDTWQQAWVEVLPDLRNFRSTANSEMTSALGAAGAAGGVAAGDGIKGGILGAIPKLAGPLLGALAALGIGRLVGQAIGSGINYGIDAVGLASDLAESANAIEVTFGEEIAAQVADLAESAPKDLKITQKAFNEYATRFSAFGKQIVGPSGDIVDWLDELTTRGADFASVYNLDVADALALFQSGLAGETEPLRKYGLDLSAAAIEAFAYSHGIAAAGDELTETQKIQARYLALLEQTASVQGDAAATSGELAGQQREFAVGLEEAQTKFGEALLPFATELLQLANEDILPALGTFLADVGPEFAQGLKDSLPGLKSLADDLVSAGPALTDFAVNTLPLLVQGLSDLLDIASGLALLGSDPGKFASEFFGITDDIPGIGSNGSADRGPLSSEEFWNQTDPGGGGSAPQIVQHFPPYLSPANVADASAQAINQILRERQ